MYSKQEMKLKESFLNINKQIQINQSLESELKTKKLTVDTILRQKATLEVKNSDLKEENSKLQRAILQGPKAQVLAGKNHDLRDKLKNSEEDRDKYENYFNKALYEKKQKDDKIKLLEGALVIFHQKLKIFTIGDESRYNILKNRYRN